MGRRDRNQFSIQIHPHQHAIVETLRDLSRKHHPYTAFSDFVEMSALALSNRFDKPQFEERENRYMDIVKRYTPEDLRKISHMFAELTLAYIQRIDELGAPGLCQHQVFSESDILGKIFSMLDIGNDRLGQYFTPGSVQNLMAQLSAPNEDGIRAHLHNHSFITLHEPACGAAGMVVAFAENVHGLGFNYPEVLHATCVDKAPLCVHMAYLQLSLMQIPAIVIHGDSLTAETWGTWLTPAHIFLGWDQKLQQRRQMESARRAFQDVEKLIEESAASHSSDAPRTRESTATRKRRAPLTAPAGVPATETPLPNAGSGETPDAHTRDESPACVPSMAAAQP